MLFSFFCWAFYCVSVSFAFLVAFASLRGSFIFVCVCWSLKRFSYFLFVAKSASGTPFKRFSKSLIFYSKMSFWSIRLVFLEVSSLFYFFVSLFCVVSLSIMDILSLTFAAASCSFVVNSRITFSFSETLFSPFNIWDSKITYFVFSCSICSF